MKQSSNTENGAFLPCNNNGSLPGLPLGSLCSPLVPAAPLVGSWSSWVSSNILQNAKALDYKLRRSGVVFKKLLIF